MVTTGAEIASPPSRAAWIEISEYLNFWVIIPRRRLHGRRGLKYALKACNLVAVQSPPSRAAWIEMRCQTYLGLQYQSPPSRAAWIEIHAERDSL